MTKLSQIAGILLLALTLTAQADESFSTLKVKDQTFTKVTVTSVTATDIYFSHASGLASAKLKDLSPELQKHFNYNAAKGAEIENAQHQATANYRANLAQAQPRTQTQAEAPKAEVADNSEDFVAPQLHARSIRGQSPPPFAIEKWLTAQPDTRGKFVLIDFWATWCGPCRKSIPELNAFYAKFSDRLAVIGLSDEPEENIRKMTSPHIDYAIASDTHQRMMGALQVQGIPHCILIDPSGIVRYEGMPQYLDDEKLAHFLNKYSK